MFTQIYTAQSADEAVTLAECGVDHVGLTPTTVGLPGQISDATAADAVTALRGRARSVALSVESSLEEITRMALAVAPGRAHPGGGVLTPAIALGDVLVDRLRAQGFTLEVHREDGPC